MPRTKNQKRKKRGTKTKVKILEESELKRQIFIGAKNIYNAPKKEKKKTSITIIALNK